MTSTAPAPTAGASPDAFPRTPRFFVELESLRGLAALSVAFFHSFHLVPVDGNRSVYLMTIWTLPSIKAAMMRLVLVVFSGGPPVSLFFVLSGFVLMGSLRRSHADVTRTSSIFMVRRLFRLCPALFLNVTVMGLLAGATLTDLLLNLPTIRTNINGVTATLSAELGAIPLILVVFFAYRRFGPPALFGSLVLALHYGLSGYVSPTVTFFFLFVFGMILEVKRPRVEATAVTVFGLVAVALLARPVVGYWSNRAFVIEGLASYYLVAAFAFGAPGGCHRSLRGAWVRFLGRVSYSFYLFHPLFLVLIAPRILDLQLDPFLTGGLIAISTILPTLPVAWLSYTFVEKRAVALGERVIGWAGLRAEPANADAVRRPGSAPAS